VTGAGGPGEGRSLSCFYAHDDKLSVQCINTLYDGMATLERAVETISYVASQCRNDIDTLCGQTVPGEGLNQEAGTNPLPFEHGAVTSALISGIAPMPRSM
jgi:hypothetical protein